MFLHNSVLALLHKAPHPVQSCLSRYRVDGVDVAQETEINKGTTKYVTWPSCAWLLHSFFPFPVKHTIYPLCRFNMKSLIVLFALFTLCAASITVGKCPVTGSNNPSFDPELVMYMKSLITYFISLTHGGTVRCLNVKPWTNLV